MSDLNIRVELPPKLVPVFANPEADVRYAFGGRGSGKCLGKGTMLLRADASLVAVEDVKEGDLLLGPDGKPRTVLGTTRGIGPLYRVTQKTGMSYVVNDAHILVLERSESAKKDFGTILAAGNPQRKNGRYAQYETQAGYSLITAAEYYAKPERFKAQHFGFRRAIVGEHKELPIDPYLLGLWLGDGTSKSPEITNIDPEIVQYLRELSDENGWTLTKSKDPNKAPRYYIGSNFSRDGHFLGMLKKANLLHNKHIPEEYFGASLEQRRALLAGLVDTDGHIGNGYIQLCQSREHLLDQIVRLAHGLGLKASKRKKIAMCNGKSCDAWSTGIGGDIDLLPLKIARKREAAKVEKNKDWRRTRIDLEPLGLGEYFGFELDGDHLFMLADGTVTHNTRSFAMMALVYALRFANAGISGQILCARQFMNSLDESSLEELKRAAQSDPRITPLFEVGDRYIRTACKRVSFSFAGLDRNIASIKSKGRILLCWIDEAEPVTDEAFNTLIPTLREEGNGWSAELWVTWNPKRKAAPVEARFRNSTDPRYVGTELNWRDNPRFPEILERQRQRDMVERPESYDHIWEGAYIQAVQGAYYARDLTKARIEGRIGKVAADPILPLKAFVDIGGTGAKADAFAMWIAQFVGKEIRMLDYYEVVGQPLAAHLEWLRGKNYTPAQCQIWLPHDGAMHDRVYSVTYESAFMSAGYRVDVMPNQGAGAAKARIEAMRRCFPQMWFNAETTQPGIDALGWYHEKWDENRGIGLGPAHDWSSHACLVAGTLIDTETGLVPIERVVAGMRVKTPAGLALVQWAGQTGEASEIVTLEGGNGQTLQCTPSHKIFTTSGVVYADAVGHNSAFITLENAPCLKSASVKSMGYRDAFIESIGASSIGIGKTTKSMPASGAAKFLSCIGSWPRAKARAHIADPLMAIGRTLTLIIGNSLSACMPKSCTSMSFKFSMANATTSGQMGILPCESTEPPSSCTGQFGNITTAKQFPQTTTFTTSMGTKATTALRTWSFFRPQTTQSTMQKPVLGWAVRVQSKHGARLNWPQWLGIKAPRAGNGIANTPRTLGLVFSLKRTMQSVFNAARNTKPLHPSGQCSAPVIVRAQTTIGKPRPVYDLTIEHHHCYFANGFLVSNCDSAGLLALAYEAQQNQRTGPATPIRRNLKGVV